MAARKKTAAKKTAKKAPAEPPAKGSDAPKKGRSRAAESEPEPPQTQEAEPEPPPPKEEPTLPKIFSRNQDDRAEDDDKAIRTLLKRGTKALGALQEVLESFEPGPARDIRNALKKLESEIETLAPPEPRKCKEYKRALAMARKGEMGIHPDDVMKYCRCDECHVLRIKAGFDHPPEPRAI